MAPEVERHDRRVRREPVGVVGEVVSGSREAVDHQDRWAGALALDVEADAVVRGHSGRRHHVIPKQIVRLAEGTLTSPGS